MKSAAEINTIARMLKPRWFIIKIQNSKFEIQVKRGAFHRRVPEKIWQRENVTGNPPELPFASPLKGKPNRLPQKVLYKSKAERKLQYVPMGTESPQQVKEWCNIEWLWENCKLLFSLRRTSCQLIRHFNSLILQILIFLNNLIDFALHVKYIPSLRPFDL